MHDRPVLVLLHFLGGSARSWDAVVTRLDGHVRCVPVDLPGFGAAIDRSDFGVAAMADGVAETIRSLQASRWILAGHSMGAKVAMVLARRAEDGEIGLEGLSHLVLITGSPPSPEPMDEERRATMLGWFAGDADRTRHEAATFIGANVAAPLAVEHHERATADLLRLNPEAWRAWLDSGSREDWSSTVGVLQTPTVIVAGRHDGDLGPEAQRALVEPHLANVRTVTIEGGKHLLPFEAADEVARVMRDVAGADLSSPDFQAVLQSDRVSHRTRAALERRSRGADLDEAPTVLSDDRLRTLRAVIGRVLPQTQEPIIDLARAVNANLANGVGDGWRYALLPPDAEAYRAALDSLDAFARAAYGADFPDISADQQDAMLRQTFEGRLDSNGPFDAERMRLWFEDLRTDAVRVYVSHPLTMQRLGFSGFANGGDGPRPQGFVSIGEGQREAWEPLPSAEVSGL